MLDYQAQNRPNKTCLLYPDLSSNPICYASATFAQVNAAANRLATKYSKQIDVSSNSQKSITVGLLANSSTDYLLTIYGLVKLGVVIFPLSTRNSKAALEHLIKTTGVSYLIVGPGQIQIELDGLKIISLENVDFDGDDNFPCSFKELEKNFLEDVQMIFHRYIKSFFYIIYHITFNSSSGSTSFPKSILYTNRSILNTPVLQMDTNKDFFNENDTVLAWGVL